MASERCVEQGSPVRHDGFALYSVRVFLWELTHGGLHCEMQMKRSGNTELSPSSYIYCEKMRLFLFQFSGGEK